MRRAGEEEPPQSVGNSVTLARNIETERQARETLLMLAESVSARLRRQKLRCRTVEVALRSEELKWTTHSMRLRYATDVTVSLSAFGLELVRQSHDFSSPLHSIGLRALELVHADEDEQIDIFIDYVNLNKQRSIDAAVDGIRAKSVSYTHLDVYKRQAPTRYTRTKRGIPRYIPQVRRQRSLPSSRQVRRS